MSQILPTVPIHAHKNCKICGAALEYAVPVYSDRCDITGLRVDNGKPDYEAMANTSATCNDCTKWAHLEEFAITINNGQVWAAINRLR
jgi:hypothetical protein